MARTELRDKQTKVEWYHFCRYFDVRITQTPIDSNGYTVVKLERRHRGEKVARMFIKVPGYEVFNIKEFTPEEVEKFTGFVKRLTDLIMIGAKTPGGLNNADLEDSDE